MEVTTQVGRDHPVDLKRVVLGSSGTVSYEHLLTLVPVEFRGGTVKFCFVGRSDVTILRQGARNVRPPESAVRPSGRFSNLAMTLRAGDVIKIGLGLIDLQLLAVDRGRATIKTTMHVDRLLLNTEPLDDAQELNLRGIIDRLNRGEDYRSDAL
ncbi:MAG: hypothetical protein ACP5XB_12520 [Isosphaeraceae bacterium]